MNVDIFDVNFAWFVIPLLLFIAIIFVASVWNNKIENDNDEIHAEKRELIDYKKSLIKDIEKLEKHKNKQGNNGKIDKETFYDVMAFMLQHNIITYQQYTDIQTKALPYL